MVPRVPQALTAREILQGLNSKGVTRSGRCAFPVAGAKSDHEQAIGCLESVVRACQAGSVFRFRGGRHIAAPATLAILPISSIADPDIRAELESCVALARETQSALESGERLTAARRAVDLVRAYDRLLENIRLVSLPATEQKCVRDRLAPIKELLRKYRLR